MKHNTGTAYSAGLLLKAFPRLIISGGFGSSRACGRKISRGVSTAAPRPHMFSSTAVRPSILHMTRSRITPTTPTAAAAAASLFQLFRFQRPFSATAVARGNWLEPALNRRKRMMKGRPRVATGGSTKGTTVVWGDYGLRMHDKHRRITAAQLKVAEDTIKQRLRGQRYRLYKRVNCNIGVFYSGNEMRMGKGKGSFDHWAARVSVNHIIFELRGAIHEQVVRDAFRLAGNKLPGQYEFVKKGDAPVVGVTKLENGVTLEDLWRPRKPVPSSTEATSIETTQNPSSPTPPPA